ncbi:MAG: antibiotic biosynthesis monooxygenase family protein [Bryobacteraceae bacterium]
MTTIKKDSGLVTVIVHLTTEPDKQQELIDTILDGVDIMRKQPPPGFVSAHLHRSHDGTRVVNYAQWRSLQDYKTFLTNPGPEERLRKILALGTPDVHTYEVVFSVNAETH